MNVARVFVVSPFITIDNNERKGFYSKKYFFLYSAEFGFPVHENLLKSIISNTSKTNVKRLQLVQNFAGWIVLGLRKYDHISKGLKSLMPFRL